MTAMENEKLEEQEDVKTNAAKENAPENTEKEDKEEDAKELFSAIFMAAVIALIIRTFAFEPFSIPSGSMFPTLKVGDYLFVSKYAYGYSQYSFPFGLARFDGRFMEAMPKQGDVAVFRKPYQTNIDYIKRIIGLPGDKIQMIAGVLHINGEPVPREYIGRTDVKDEMQDLYYTEYWENLPNGVKHKIYEITDEEQLDDTMEFRVPTGNYFVMGDNRDGSMDSRVIDQVGFVPAENLIGRAEFIFFSVEPLPEGICKKEGTLQGLRATACRLPHWFKNIRFERLFDGIS